jgi:hypothetical protein
VNCINEVRRSTITDDLNCINTDHDYFSMFVPFASLLLCSLVDQNWALGCLVGKQ